MKLYISFFVANLCLIISNNQLNELRLKAWLLVIIHKRIQQTE
jgi:hypothetical protein